MRQYGSSVAYLCSILLLFGSCKKDAYTPCEQDGASPGKVCREYRYAGEDLVGTIRWEWNGERLRKKTFSIRKNEENSYILYHYDDTHYRRTETTYNSRTGEAVIFREWENNSQGKILRFWENDHGSSLYRLFTYDTEKRLIRVDEDINHVDETFQRLSYDSNDSLYKITKHRSGDEAFLGIVRISYFPDATRRDYYDEDYIRTGHDVRRFQGGKEVFFGVYDDAGKMEEEIEYRYNEAGLLWLRTFRNNKGETGQSEFVYH